MKLRISIRNIWEDKSTASCPLLTADCSLLIAPCSPLIAHCSLLTVPLFLAVYLMLTGCESVKPYQRVYVNDYEMQPGQHGARRFEEYVQTYREGASGGGSSKSSGGCGCN